MSFDGMRRPSFSQANVQIAGASELMSPASEPNTLVVPVCALVPTPDIPAGDASRLAAVAVVAAHARFPPRGGCGGGLCRPLDRVALKGSKEPMMLFSFEPRMDERKRYFDRFELGVEAYLNGEWEQARALLEGCVNSDPGDRPPAVLLEYMEERDFVAPPTWSGHRELTSK